MNKELKQFSDAVVNWRDKALNTLTFHYSNFIKDKYKDSSLPDVIYGDKNVIRSKSNKKDIIDNVKIGTPSIENDIVKNNIYINPDNMDVVHDAKVYELDYRGPFYMAKVSMTYDNIEKVLNKNNELPSIKVTPMEVAPPKI